MSQSSETFSSQYVDNGPVQAFPPALSLSPAPLIHNMKAHSSSSSSLTDFYVGLGLALSSSLFIGSSFIFSKLGLLRLAKSHSSVRAGDGGFGYLRDWIWWTGLILMGIGELANFVAYAFAPASLVTPLGALSVLVTAILSSRFLHERLNLLGKLGCILCVAGSVMIVIHSPKQQEVQTMTELLPKFRSAGFISYLTIALVACVFFALVLAPRYGNKNPMVYITITAIFGSFSVVSCKILGVALRNVNYSPNGPTVFKRSAGENLVASGQDIFKGKLPALKATTFYINDAVSNTGDAGVLANPDSLIDNATEAPLPFFYLVIISITVLAFILIQMNYLNRALDIFSANLVTPLLYVSFTFCVILASNILFQEWARMSVEDWLGGISGFVTILVAIFLLNVCKDLNINFTGLSSNFRKCSTNGSGKLAKNSMTEASDSSFDNTVQSAVDV